MEPTIVVGPFAYIKPKDEETKAKMCALREAFNVIHDHVVTACRPSRQTSLALTKLEESAMWANKAIAFNQDGAEIVA